MSFFFRVPFFQPLNDGTYRVNLQSEEREILEQLCRDHIAVIKDHDDGSTMRMFPPAYGDDISKQIEYEALMRNDLEASHVAAIETMHSTLGQKILDENQLHTWSRALNQVRLVLGTRLDMSDDDEQPAGLDEEGQVALELYRYLGGVQNDAIEALLDSLPEGDDDAGKGEVDNN